MLDWHSPCVRLANWLSTLSLTQSLSQTHHAAPGSGKSTIADACTAFWRGMGRSVSVTAHTGVAVAGRGRTLYSQLGLKPDPKGNYCLNVQFPLLVADKRRMKQLVKIDVCHLRLFLFSSECSRWGPLSILPAPSLFVYGVWCIFWVCA